MAGYPPRSTRSGGTRIGKFKRDGPSAFGAGGGPPFGSLGGVSNVRNQSLAYGLDYALSPSLLVDFRFGWFQYKVDVLPGDFGTTPAADAGIPGLNNDETFSSGLPYFEIRGNQPDMDWGWSLNDNAGRCNCPLAQDEKQWQAVGNITKLWGNHTSKVGLDIRRAYNLRIPSDNHRSGQLSFNHERTGSPTLGGGLGLATFMLGDVTRLARYISATFEARERQWRHAYYAQDTWRVNPKLTLNYGLRLDVINPQTVNEPGNGTWVDLSTGQGLVGGIGNIDLAGNVENRLNWAPRLGATYQLNEKTVIRGGYGRSYDLGVFGSLFGHTVTQNLPVLANQVLNRPNQFASVFNLAAGPPAPNSVPVGPDGTFPWPDGVTPRVVPRKMRPPEVDAWNVSGQRQLTDTMSVEIGYVANHGRHVFGENNPDERGNEAAIDGFAEGVPHIGASPLLRGRRPSERARHRWRLRLDAGRADLLQRGAELVPVDAGQVHASVLRWLVCAGQLHAAESGGRTGRVLDLRSRSEQGPFRLRSDAQLHGRDHLRTAIRQGQEVRGANGAGSRRPSSAAGRWGPTCSSSAARPSK